MAKRSFWRHARECAGLAAAVAMVLFLLVVRHPVEAGGFESAPSAAEIVASSVSVPPASRNAIASLLP